MESHCEGKRVLVTGGAAGIGRAIVEAFVRAGARVHLCDINPVTISDVETHVVDVANPRAVNELFEKIDALDVLVNNAGIAGPTKPIDEITDEEWRHTFAVNVDGAFYCTRRAVPLLRAAGGSIVNIASTAGRLGYPLRTPYAASKWALVGLTKTLAAELGEYAIRVNAILPAMVEGERIEQVLRDKAAALDISQEEMRQRFLQTTSLGNMISPDEIAQMVLFLSDETGKNISGQIIGIDGDTQRLV